VGLLSFPQTCVAIFSNILCLFAYPPSSVARVGTSAHDRSTQDADVQRVCAESEELRTLREALAAAQLNRVRSVQRQEKELLAAHERSRQAELDAAMERHRQAEEERLAREEQQRLEEAQRRRIQLNDQLDEREARRQQAYEEHLRERAQVCSNMVALRLHLNFV